MGNLGAEKAKNQGLGWQQGCGGGALVKAPEEKWGKMGKAPEEKWGKMGENGGKWGKMGRKWGGNGGKGDQLHHPSFLIFPHFSPFPPHFPPFSPIFPHFPPFFLAMGTLWVRLWVQYPPPEPGTSEPWGGVESKQLHTHEWPNESGVCQGGNVSAPGARRARAGHLFGPVPHR